MTSQIDSSFIAAGPVSKSLMRDALDTAGAEISDLQGVGPFYYGNTSGTGSAFTVTSPADRLLTLTPGLSIIVVFHTDPLNNATLQVDALSAQTIKRVAANGVFAPVATGTVPTGVAMMLTYSPIAAGWVLSTVGDAKHGLLTTVTRSISAALSSPGGFPKLVLDSFVCGDGQAALYDVIGDQFVGPTGCTMAQVAFHASWAGNANGFRQINVTCPSNTASFYQTLDAAPYGAGPFYQTLVTPKFPLTAGQRVQVGCFHNSGVNLAFGLTGVYHRGVFVTIDFYR